MLTLSPADNLLLDGFGERVTFAALRRGRMSAVPTTEQGVYGVVFPFDGPPTFLSKGTCGSFRGAPYPVADLSSWWVPESRILYIGKAGGPDIDEKLYDRVQKYSSFGLGKNVPHGGGRAIWQIEESDRLEVCWKPTPDRVPRDVEIELIAAFKRRCGMRPFANRRG
jgi:hypothetical protein